jgi:hypothetical protein
MEIRPPTSSYVISSVPVSADITAVSDLSYV